MADYTDPLVLQARKLSASTVSALFSACILAAVLHVKTAEKPDDIFGVGNPSTQTVLSGAKSSDVRLAAMDQDGAYEILEETILQSDYKMMDYRGTVAQASAWSGSNPTFTYTTDGAGTVTAITVTGAGSGFSGAPPTLLLIDALGSAGNGVVLQATVSTGGIASVAVLNGGIGYAASGGTILVNAGYSEGEKYSRPVVKWCHMQHVARVYDNDVKSALEMVKNADKEDTVMSVYGDALQRTLAAQFREINQKLWTAAPSDQTAQQWDNPFGLLAAVDDGGDANNTGYGGNYLGVDRTSAANYWFRSPTDATTHANWTLEDLVLDMNQTKGLIFKGSGPDILVVNPTKYTRFAKDATSRVQEINLGDNESLRGLGMYGFRQTALKYGNTYCVSDYLCPKNTVMGLHSKSLKIMFKSGEKFAPSQRYDQHGLDNGFEGFKFFVNTKFRIANEAPMLSVKYTSIQ